MKNLLLVFVMLLVPLTILKAENSEYQDWENEEVVGIYKEISVYEAMDYGCSEEFEDGNETRYFTKVRLDEGLYEVEVKEKVSSRFWGINYTRYFMKFRYNPYLYKYDEGVLDWNGYDGIFYKEP